MIHEYNLPVKSEGHQNSANYRDAGRMMGKARRRAAFVHSDAEQFWRAVKKKEQYGSVSNLQLLSHNTAIVLQGRRAQLSQDAGRASHLRLERGRRDGDQEGPVTCQVWCPSRTRACEHVHHVMPQVTEPAIRSQSTAAMTRGPPTALRLPLAALAGWCSTWSQDGIMTAGGLGWARLQ